MAIAKIWTLDPGWTIVGSFFIIILAVLLLVFAKLGSARKNSFAYAAIVLMWFCVLLFIIISVLLASCAFFGWPRNIDAMPILPRKQLNETAVLPNTAGSVLIETILTDTDAVIEVGKLHTYTFWVRNSGNATATNVAMTLDLPDGMEFFRAITGGYVVLNDGSQGNMQVQWFLDKLLPEQQRTIVFLLRPTRAGEMLITSSLTCSESKLIRDDELSNAVDP